MGSTTKNSKAVSQVSRELKNSKAELKISLSDSSFAVINDAIAKNNHFQAEAQKSFRELQNNLLLAIESAGYKVDDFAGVNLNQTTKELILTKK